MGGVESSYRANSKGAVKGLQRDWAWIWNPEFQSHLCLGSYEMLFNAPRAWFSKVKTVINS